MHKRSLRLVIVDDDDGIRSAAQMIARQTFPTAAIAAFSTCSDALRTLRPGSMDLLITNCHMPDMDGATMVRKLREANFTLPIIMISGSEEARKLGEEAGIDEFVSKQFLFRDLPSTLKGLLGRNSWTAGADLNTPPKK
jgi:DNA-binding response OmpR family regulator